MTAQNKDFVRGICVGLGIFLFAIIIFVCGVGLGAKAQKQIDDKNHLRPSASSVDKKENP